MAGFVWPSAEVCTCDGDTIQHVFTRVPVIPIPVALQLIGVFVGGKFYRRTGDAGLINTLKLPVKVSEVGRSFGGIVQSALT